MFERISKLIDVKSLVTLTITAIFSILSYRGDISADKFLTIYTTIIAFYFGTQYQKSKEDKT